MKKIVSCPSLVAMQRLRDIIWLLQQPPNQPALIHIQRLQSVQNVTARLIFNLRRCDHITDALISLHWLCVPQRITFKVAMLTYRALHGSVPPYLASSFTCVANMPHRRRLRSASTGRLDVPTCHLSAVGGRALPVAGANVWNSWCDISFVTGGVQEQAQDVLVPPLLLRNCLTLNDTFFSESLRPSSTVVLTLVLTV